MIYARGFNICYVNMLGVKLVLHFPVNGLDGSLGFTGVILLYYLHEMFRGGLFTLVLLSALLLGSSCFDV
jgi:hypothetical protein